MEETQVKYQQHIDEALTIDTHTIIAEIRETTASISAVCESIVSATTNFGFSVYSANEDFSRAYRQLCNVMSVAEIKQRSAMQRLEKQTRKALHGVILKVTIAIALSAVAGAAIGASITTLMTH
ncbi:hypothetical protein [Pseudomonas azerbaijanoccidentalis]